MTNGLAIFLSVLTVCISAVLIAAFYFLSSLSEKVSKLNAATTLSEFRGLTQKPRKAPKPVKVEPTGETAPDGTLTSQALDKIFKRDPVI
jgi:hypothetical protein